MSKMDDFNYCQILSFVKPTRQIKKSELIRSIIGVLSGTQSNLFKWDDDLDEFVVEENMTMNDMGETLLRSYLKDYCKYGTAMKKMYDFCFNQLDNENDAICYTLSAYRSCMRVILFQLIKRLNSLYEKIIINKLQLIELERFLNQDENDNILITIEILWQIFTEVKTSAFEKLFNVNVVLTILKATYSRIDFEWVKVKNLIFTLFLYFIKPTFEYFDRILTEGIALDPHKEFLFEFSELMQKRETFWDDCVQIREVNDEMPSFLLENMDMLLIAVRSSAMLRNVSNQFENFGNLFNDFIILLNKSIDENRFPRESSINFHDFTHFKKYSTHKVTGEMQLNDIEMKQGKTIYDRNLNYFNVFNFHQSLYCFEKFSFSLNDNENFNEFDVYCLPGKTIKPLDLIIKECINTILTKYCNQVSTGLIHVISCEFNKHFENFCNYFLMRSIGKLWTFCLCLFKCIQDSDDIINNVINDIDLQQSLVNFDDDYSIKPFISLNNISSLPFKLMDNVYLLCCDISWPFNIIFGNDIIEVYNQVFQILLKIKYSNWSLNQLMFTKRFKLNVGMDEMLLIRFKLQNSVSKLHNHLMFVVDLAIKETIQQCEQAKDFAQLIMIHNDFVIKLKETIFQKNNILNKITKKLFKLCSKLNENWDKDYKDDKLKSQFVLLNEELDGWLKLLDIYYRAVIKII